MDIRFDSRDFLKHGTFISYLAIENVLDRKNVAGHFWNPAQQEVRTSYQTGRFFVGGFSYEF